MVIDEIGSNDGETRLAPWCIVYISRASFKAVFGVVLSLHLSKAGMGFWQHNPPNLPLSFFVAGSPMPGWVSIRMEQIDEPGESGE